MHSRSPTHLTTPHLTSPHMTSHHLTHPPTRSLCCSRATPRLVSLFCAESFTQFQLHCPQENIWSSKQGPSQPPTGHLWRVGESMAFNLRAPKLALERKRKTWHESLFKSCERHASHGEKGVNARSAALQHSFLAISSWSYHGHGACQRVLRQTPAL